MKKQKRLDELRNGFKNSIAKNTYDNAFNKMIEIKNENQYVSTFLKEGKHNIHSNLNVTSKRKWRFLRSASIMVFCLSILIGCTMQIKSKQTSDVTLQLGKVEGGYRFSDALTGYLESINTGEPYVDGIIPADVVEEKVIELDLRSLNLLTDKERQQLLEEVAYFSSLVSLDISGLRIANISALSSLHNLMFLLASDNKIRDIRPIIDLPYIAMVSLSNNEIELNQDNINFFLEKSYPGDTSIFDQRAYIANISVSEGTFNIDTDMKSSRSDVDKAIDEYTVTLRPVNAKQIRAFQVMDITVNCSSEFFGKEIEAIEVGETGSMEYSFQFNLFDNENTLLFCLDSKVNEFSELSTYHKLTVMYKVPVVSTDAVVTSAPNVTTTPKATTTSRKPTTRRQTSKVTSTSKLPEVEVIEDYEQYEPIPEKEVIDSHEENEPPEKPVIPPTSDDSNFDKKFGEPQVNGSLHKSSLSVDSQSNITNLTGWLHADDLLGDLPVFQGSDNSYYLNHDRNGKISKAGELFIDYKYQVGDKVSIIYGHHMRDGSMFAPLLRIVINNIMPSFEWSRIVEINEGFLSIEKIQYEIVGAYYYDTNSDNFDYTQTNYNNLNEFVEFVHERNVTSKKKELNKNNEFLLLSTCNYDAKGDRFVVVLQTRSHKEMRNILLK